MNTKENCLSIIDDKNVDKFGRFKAYKKKNGYIINYPKKSRFKDNIEVDDETPLLFVFGTILVGMVQLGLIASIPSIFVWALIPCGLVISVLYYICHSKSIDKLEIILRTFLSIVALCVTWAVLNSALNCNFFNDSDWGKRQEKYVFEHVNPIFVKFKR